MSRMAAFFEPAIFKKPNTQELPMRWSSNVQHAIRKWNSLQTSLKGFPFSDIEQLQAKSFV